jgi:hypothetical protein
MATQTKTDTFTDGLRQRLEGIDTQIHRMKTDLRDGMRQDNVSIEARITDARKHLEITKSNIEDVEAKSRNWIENRTAAGMAVIQGWKNDHNQEKLNHHALSAEEHAQAAIDIAECSIAEAAVATYEAMEARIAATTGK